MCSVGRSVIIVAKWEDLRLLTSTQSCQGSRHHCQAGVSLSRREQTRLPFREGIIVRAYLLGGKLSDKKQRTREIAAIFLRAASMGVADALILSKFGVVITTKAEVGLDTRT